MHRRAIPILAGAILFAPASVLAQDADHSDRGDVADFRDHEDDGQPEPYEIGLDGRPEPSWSLSIGVPVLYDTNPFWDPDGSEDAVLFSPSLALTYAHPELIPGWDLELSGGADADFFSNDPDELNEGRLNATATVFHRIAGAGTLSLGFRARWVYLGESFDHFDHSLQRYVVAFAPDISDKVGISLSGEYRDSGQPENRRVIGTANFDVTILDTPDVRVGFFQEFAYSSYTAGANDGREDLLSLSEVSLTPGFELPDGMRLNLAAILFHRFSNFESSRFTAVQVGPTLGFSF
ncbi:hypothetical protein KK137_11385 [Croceibacterium sp. LX-88]|uniref:Outer membrane beta-barrel porin/alpha-amylase n=1 Tax=Croceibacterium selenioxidans TaxID=2838833 RepID=A0ABS5W5B3_9SPHN|nr:hypothetical protein [Croceibacterium selenioxidans]MBT2134936.1 hypothetical protein [Croceibacterium selenioxidans]